MLSGALSVREVEKDPEEEEDGEFAVDAVDDPGDADKWVPHQCKPIQECCRFPSMFYIVEHLNVPLSL